jgi:23S rRNA (uracil1939-C5)-methyltransferase
MSKRQGARVVDLEIETLGADGFGVARFDRRPVHVKGTLPGEVVSAHIVRRRHGSWYALPQAWLVKAATRATPACAAFMRCGGCSMQHLTRADQLTLKQQWLIDQLGAAGVVAGVIEEPVTGPQYFYRRRARLAVRSVRDTGELLVGFRESFGSRVARLQSCCVLVPSLSDGITRLAEMIAALDAREAIPQIEVAAGAAAAALILRHVQPLTAADQRALDAFQRETQTRVLCQSAGYDSVVDLQGRGAELLSYRLDGFGVTLWFHPADFIQVNAAVNAELVANASSWLAPTPRDVVLDLFCGIGNFTLPLARSGAAVCGLEGAQELVERGRLNAQRNGLARRVEFVAVDLYAASPAPELTSRIGAATKVLLDPPRTGAGALLPLLARGGARRIAYVSCHPVSFARDAAVLIKAGFRLSRVRIFDMFPHTTHVETLGLFERSWSN